MPGEDSHDRPEQDHVHDGLRHRPGAVEHSTFQLEAAAHVGHETGTR